MGVFRKENATAQLFRPNPQRTREENALKSLVLVAVWNPQRIRDKSLTYLKCNDNSNHTLQTFSAGIVFHIR